MAASLIIARKEIRDHLRDTRSLVSTASYALIGPAALLLVALSRPGSGARSAILWSMASVFALVSAFAGGMNVALDAMAGERERRSLVPLLLTPVARRDVVIGKWIATVVFGLAVLLLTAAGCVAVFLISPASPGEWALLTPAGTWVLAGLMPLVLMGSACHLVVAAKSASAKEAHTWTSSLVFVPMMVGLGLVFLPGASQSWWPFVPLVGQQAWIGRTLAGQDVSAMSVVVLAAVTLAAAWPPLWWARRGLDRDDLLAG